MKTVLKKFLLLKNYFSLLIFFCVLGLFSCKKKHDPGANPQVNVYVAGSESNGTHSIAKYWKNGKPVSLTDGSKDAWSTSIAVAGNDVYVTTIEEDATHYIAKFRKNGKPVTLIDGSPYADVGSIVISGSDVFIAGDEEDNQENGVAKYWKNDVPVIINPAPGFSLTKANSMAVSGSDVYVAGWSSNGDEGMAEYWKNGIPVILNDPAEYFGRAMSIAIAGNDVYVGLEKYPYDGENRTAAIWKNGIMTDLLDSTNGIFHETFMGSIAVAGNNVYATGDIFDGVNWVPRYWKNSISIQMGLPDDSFGAIALSGNDIYIAGSGKNGSHNVAKYWKNGNAIALTDGTNNAYALSIFLSTQ
jgi:hypothetical protein